MNIFWLGLGVVYGGINPIVFPRLLMPFGDPPRQAALYGLLIVCGLLAGAVVQSLAGAASDVLHPLWGRKWLVGMGLFFLLVSLALFSFTGSLLAVCVGYLLIQVSANWAQAAQQGFLPDLSPHPRRGIASGMKGFMEAGGVLLGLVCLRPAIQSGYTGLALLAVGALLVCAYLMTAFSVVEPQKPLPIPAQPRAISHIDAQVARPAVAWLVATRFLFWVGCYAALRLLMKPGFSPMIAPARLSELDQLAQLPDRLGIISLMLLVVLAFPGAGWLADHLGRFPAMFLGMILCSASALFLAAAQTSQQVFISAIPLALGSVLFITAHWAIIADLAQPAHRARFFALVNYGTSAAIGLISIFHLLTGWGNVEAWQADLGSMVILAVLTFLGSGLVLRRIVSRHGLQRASQPLSRAAG